MHYELKKLPKAQIQITVSVSEDKMVDYRKQASESLSKEVKIKGFRPGHVPANILESYLGEEVINEQAQDIAVKMSYREVVVKENLLVITRPEVKIESKSPLSFVFTVDVMPEVELKNYQDIKVKREEVKVKDEDIQQAIDQMRKYATTYKEIETEAKKGNRVEVDFEGFDDKGEAVANTKSTNHPVILGENTLIPGFEDELTGLKKNEKKEFDITFPKDYGKEDLRSKKLHFKVEIKMVEEAIQPELNEEFIEKMSGKKQSLEEFKKVLEENIKNQKEVETKQKQENEYMEKLLEKARVELSDNLINEESHHILAEMKDEIQARKIDFDRFLEQAKTTEEDLLKKYHKEAERRLKVRLILQHLIKEEKIEVTEAELKAELEKIKSNYPPSEDKKIDQEFEQGSLRNSLENRLLLTKFFKKMLA